MAGTGYYDNGTAVKTVIDAYGADRVAGVLAANINNAVHDGRFSAQNREWAAVVTSADKPDYYLNTHRAILNGFADKLREAIQQAQEKFAPNESKDFIPPEKSETAKNVENYLTEKMGMDKGIVKSCIEQGLVYQTEVHSEKLDKDLPCAVFAGFDETGEMQSAVIKGFGTYEKVAAGSALKYAFVLPAKENKDKPTAAVSVFENPLEVLAGATLAKMDGKAGYDGIHRISAVKTWLYSTHAKALKTFLDSNPNVRTVNLCLTHSADVSVLADRISAMLKDLGERRGETFKVNSLIPADANGYLEKLQNKNKETKAKQKPKENRE
jgi:hypothetical protein